jgi:4-carboxymuconolactone decarboxylase
VNYRDCLRLLALNDAAFVEGCTTGITGDSPALAAREVALARLGALIAVGAAVASYGEFVDAALDAGVTAAEIVDVLVRIIPVAGAPRVVREAPKLAMALGYDVDAESQEGGAP